MAHVAMVMNLDKCIGCHTCTVTCKQVWTNRPGTEYVYFNNVETKPGIGYPKRYEDQQQWHGGWTLDRKGRLQLKSGSRLRRLLSIFYNPDLPTIDDYGDPWTYDYQTVIDAPLGTPNPSAHSISALTGRDMTVKWGSNFDDDLAGAPELAVDDPDLAGLEDRVKMEFEQVFMFYLPRICEHCLNPSCVASCPSGRCTSAPRTGSCWSTRTAAGAGGSVCRAARIRRCISITAPARRKNARFAIRASSRPCRRSARRPVWAGCAIWGWCSMTPTGCSTPRPRPTSRTCMRPSWGCSSTRMTRTWWLRLRDKAFHTTGFRRRNAPGLRVGGAAQSRAAAAPGISHVADGLVHPAAVTGGRRGRRGRLRRQPRPRVRHHRRAAYPDGVPGQPVHRG
ncbi:4Fe-4S binding domain protein [Mycobacterium xenopi 3993]|nr:4Fe-4S binding domain protein [Mycobacterium xenopi 3993]